jgi:hypothetical protein
MNCRFCGEPAVEQAFTRESLCEVHLNKMLVKAGELIDRASFMCSVMNDIEDLGEARWPV